MEADEVVMKLFDAYWFQHCVLAPRVIQLRSPSAKNQQIQHSNNLSGMVKLQVRSISARCLSYVSTSPHHYDSSPNSVVTTPKLQRILSGKEIGEFSKEEIVEKEQLKSVKRKMSTNRRRRHGLSRSLTDLEFEELKGFMDLGFVFSEEDKTSRLVSIIPGLQRWGQKSSSDEEEQSNNHQVQSPPIVSRPYLSEAWEVLDQRKAHRKLSKWRLPALLNEGNMKNHLKAWAQTVASTVR